MKKILFICENGLENQSTKHRVLDIIKYLKIKEYKIYCGKQVKLGKSIVRIISILDFFKIILNIFIIDIIFIQRTSTIFIYFICIFAKFFKKKIIFDVDDSIFEKKIRNFKNP